MARPKKTEADPNVVTYTGNAGPTPSENMKPEEEVFGNNRAMRAYPKDYEEGRKMGYSQEGLKELFGNIPSIKTVQMHAGVDLLGSKTSIHNSNAEIYELKHGVLAVSRKADKKTGVKRKVVIPYTNIRAYELL